jgi:hypothetical protein
VLVKIMELHLRYRSTGKLVTLRRAKVLSNSSGHPDGKTKLAFFVPYRSRWVFYPLNRGPRIEYNDEPARGPCKLSAGDLIGLHGAELIVESLSVDEPSPGSGGERSPTCWLTILGGTERWHTSTNTEMLVGSAEHCGLCLPPTPGIEAEHAYLAYAEGAWHVHSLTGQNDLIQALGHEGKASVRLEATDRIWLGSSGISIRFTPEAPDEPAPAPAKPARTVSTDTVPEHNLAETAENLPTEEVIPPLTDHSTEPAYSSAKQLCVWLHKVLHEPPSTSSSRVWEALVAVKTRLGRRSKDPSVALEQIKADLEQSPHNRDLLIELARHLEKNGYYDLCRLVLAEVHVLEPKDFDTLLALVKLYLMEGRQIARPLGERLDMLHKAERWGHKAQLLRPRHDELLTLVQKAEVEQTLLKGNLSGAHAAAPVASH